VKKISVVICRRVEGSLLSWESALFLVPYISDNRLKVFCSALQSSRCAACREAHANSADGLVHNVWNEVLTITDHRC
jgi:hypothetical protein